MFGLFQGFSFVNNKTLNNQTNKIHVQNNKGKNITIKFEIYSKLAIKDNMTKLMTLLCLYWHLKKSFACFCSISISAFEHVLNC